MPDLCTTVVPRAVQRRLTLALAGWRFEAGTWTWHGLWPVTEEGIDQMTDRAFECFVMTWAASAVSAL